MIIIDIILQTFNQPQLPSQYVQSRILHRDHLALEAVDCYFHTTYIFYDVSPSYLRQSISYYHICDSTMSLTLCTTDDTRYIITCMMTSICHQLYSTLRWFRGVRLRVCFMSFMGFRLTSHCWSSLITQTDEKTTHVT